MAAIKNVTLALVLAVSTSCGGGGSSTGSSPGTGAIAASPSPTPSPTSSPTPAEPFDKVAAALDAYSASDIAVIVGTREGIAFTRIKGAFALDRSVAIASASKWMASATIMRLVERGTMRLDDRPQQYLDFWTNDPADARSRVTLEQLLSFTSGFDSRNQDADCTLDPTTTVQACAGDIYADGPDGTPGEQFAYGNGHLHIAAAMAEKASGLAFADLFEREIAVPLGLSDQSAFAFPSRANPLVAGGATSSANDYALFLDALVAGRIVADLDTFLADRTGGVPITFRPRAASNAGDWRYALGAFVECDSPEFDSECAADQIYSSPGLFGWTPWIDRKNGYWALIATAQPQGAPATVALEQELQPLIVEALSR